MTRKFICALGLAALSGLAAAETRCDTVLRQLARQLVDTVCFESDDLTTTNPLTTPADNVLPANPPPATPPTPWPAFAFTPRRDRDVIAPSAARRPPIAKKVPGVQLMARFANDATGQGRFLLRLPDDWNGSLVVAGASGTRSEFNGDFAWSDFVLQKGFAYASQNKGVLNLALSNKDDPLACRLNPLSATYVRFYDNEAGQPFTRWRDFMVAAADVARRGVQARYGYRPRHTYAVGTSNGGYQVRRAIESAPELFDGGVDWEGTFVDAQGPNLLTDLPAAVLNYPASASTDAATSALATKNMLAAGYPPDLPAALAGTPSLWANHSAAFWEVTQCQWQKRLDPTFDTYGNDGTATYNYTARLAKSDVGAQLEAIANTGRIKRPLITVAGTLDALLPIDHHARAYARLVRARSGGDDDDRHGGSHRGPGRDNAPPYRLYEVQNGNHLETYADLFPQLELILPHAQRAFDLLVRHVEQRTPLPPDQCIGRGGLIVEAPSAVGSCPNLLVP